MANDYTQNSDGLTVDKVYRMSQVNNNDHGDPEKKKDRHPDHLNAMRHPKEYLKALSMAAEKSNRDLAGRKLPYRFCIYEEKGEVMIDLVRLDETGKIVQETKRNITNENFDRLIEDVSSIEGLFLDRQG